MRYLYDVSAHGERPRARPPRSARPRKAEPAIEDLGAVARKPRSIEEIPSSFGKRGWLIFVAVLAIALTAGGFLVNAATTRSNRAAAVTSRSTARNAVIFVVNGAGPGDFSAHHLPTIHRLIRSGMVYKNAWTGEPTLSSAESNATLSTGVFPHEHGIVGSEWQDAASTQPAGILRPSQVMIGSVDQSLEASNLSPLAEALKNSQPRSRILSIGGQGCASASAAGTWVADYVLCPVRSGHDWVPGSVAGHELPTHLASASGWKVRATTAGGLGPALEGWSLGMQDHWIADYASWVMNQIRPRITIINFPEIETIAPWTTPADRPAVVQRLMRGIDSEISAILAKTRTWSNSAKTTYVLTSDGAVNEANGVLRLSRLQEAVAAAGGETTYLVGGPTAAIGLKDHLQLDPAVQALQAENLGNVDFLFSKTRRPGQWLYSLRWARPSLSQRTRNAVNLLMQTVASSLSPDIAVVPHPGTEVGRPRLGHLQRGGLFGGLSWNSERIPLILWGKGVQSGQISTFFARLVDIVPTLEFLMRLPATPTDGIVLGDGLAAPTTHVLIRQNIREQQVRFLTRGLQTWG